MGFTNSPEVVVPTPITVTPKDTQLPVVNASGTVIQTADAQDFLFFGAQTVPTTPVIPLSLYVAKSTPATLATTGPGTPTPTHTGVAGADLTTAGRWPMLSLQTPFAGAGAPTAEPVFGLEHAFGATYTGALLTGKQLLAGRYTFTIPWVRTTGTALPVVDVHVRWGTVKAAVYTQAGSDLVLTGQSPPATLGHLVVTGTLPAITFPTATTHPYLEVALYVRTAGNGSILTPVGGITTLRVVTPGYKGKSSTSIWAVKIPGANVKKSYSALAVVVYSPTGRPLCVSAVDTSLRTLHTRVAPFVAPFVAQPAPGGRAIAPFTTATPSAYQAVVPFGNEPGDTMALRIALAAPGTGTVTVYGLTANPGIELRDGARTDPVGGLVANATTHAAGTTTVIGPPGATLHILLAAGTIATYAASASTAVGTLTAHVNGAAKVLAYWYPTPTGQIFNVDIPDNGLLCDVNTAVTLTNSAATKYAAASLTYDVVF